MGAPTLCRGLMTESAPASALCAAGAGLGQLAGAACGLSAPDKPRLARGQLTGSPARDSHVDGAFHVERSVAGFLSEVCFPGGTTTI